MSLDWVSSGNVNLRSSAERTQHSRAVAQKVKTPTTGGAPIKKGVQRLSEHPAVRQAHNLKVAGSNPAPATNLEPESGFKARFY